VAERPWKKLVRDLTDAGHESPYLERLRARVDTAQAQADLERELVQEMATALGRTEEKVNAALLRLELAGRDLDQASAGPEREACLARFHALRDAALAARHELAIHREAVGFRRNAILELLYPIPGRRR